MAGEQLVGTRALGSGARFEVVVADLLGESTDAIVNAANGGLAHGGGVAAAIAEAAGPGFDDESDALVRRQGRIPVGGAAATGAGRLPFKAVIHVVGPRQGDGDEQRKLVKALHAGFAIADGMRLASLSFPAVSAGIYSVPAAVCARAYLQAVESYFTVQRMSSIALVRLCLVEGPLVAEMRKLLAAPGAG